MTLRHMPSEIMVDCRSPDPTNAINGFLLNMNNARALGFTPSSAHMMAEHFLRNDVSLVFYSSAGGIISLAADDEALDSDDSFEVVKFVIERVVARRRKKREGKAAEAFAAFARDALARIEAETDETTQLAQPVGRQPDKLQNQQPNKDSPHA